MIGAMSSASLGRPPIPVRSMGMPMSSMGMPTSSSVGQRGAPMMGSQMGGYASVPGTPQVPLPGYASSPQMSTMRQLSAVPQQVSQPLSQPLSQLPSQPLPQPVVRPSLQDPQFSARGHSEANGVRQSSQKYSGDLQAEIARRQTAEARVRELEALVTRLRQRVAQLEGKRPPQNSLPEQNFEPEEDGVLTDPIDRTICEYLERNPDFPVSVQKVAPNYYVFGDRGTVYVTQRGEHVVVRVGGGFKSLQVFMDERALMVTRENAAALSEKQQHGLH